MKEQRAAIYVGVAILAVGVFGLLLMRRYWEEWAPWPIRWHVGALAFALSLGVFLWLRKPPSFGSTSIRRRRRLRDRYRDNDGD